MPQFSLRTSSEASLAHAHKLDLLLATYITAVVVAELMGSKTFSLWIFTASVAIFTLPITFVINDIVTEVEGKARAISFMRSTFFILLLLTLFNLLALTLPPSTRAAAFEPAYQTIFGKSLRMTLASLTSFFLAERLDIAIFSKIHARFKNSGLWLRSNVSNIVSMFADTVFFMFLAFFDGHNAAFVWSLILPYWVLKCTCSIMQTPLTYTGVRWLHSSK